MSLPICSARLCSPSFAIRKWFMTAIGHQGLNNLLAAYTDKSAEAVCTFGYSPGPGHKPILFQGRCPVRRGLHYEPRVFSVV